MLWPLGLTIGVWFLASLVIGRLYPEAIQRFTVEPNQYAQEERYIAQQHRDDPARVRARRLGGPVVPRRGRRSTAAAIEAEADTFRNARLWDYRPLGDTLDQLQRVRRYYDFVDVDTDRYIIDGVQRQVMLSARELALEQNPAAAGFVNQRIIYTHGIGAAMVPVNEVANEGQPRLFIRNLPPVSTDGAPEITEPRIYFGERPSDYVITGARQAEFDYPDRRGRRRRRSGHGDALDRARPASASTRRCMRLLFALRFRDLDLLISDQVTADSQLLIHRSLARPARRASRRSCATTRTRTSSSTATAGWSTSRTPTRCRTASRTRRRSTRGAELEATGLGTTRSTTSATASRSRWTPTTARCTFYVADPTDPLIRAYAGHLPDAVPAARRRCPTDLRAAPARARGAVQRPDPGVRAVPRHATRCASSRATTCGPCRRRRAASRASRRRRTTWSCGCPARRRPSSCSSSRWCRSTART